MEGKVVRLMADRKFGFIRGEDMKDYFFHQQDLNGFFDDLVSDTSAGHVIMVTFDIVPSPKGPRASNVTRADWPNQAV